MNNTTENPTIDHAAAIQAIDAEIAQLEGFIEEAGSEQGIDNLLIALRNARAAHVARWQVEEDKWHAEEEQRQAEESSQLPTLTLAERIRVASLHLSFAAERSEVALADYQLSLDEQTRASNALFALLDEYNNQEGSK